MHAEAGRVTVGKNPRGRAGTVRLVEGGDVVPELDEDGGEASSTVSGRALLGANAGAGRVSHVVVGLAGVQLLAVPARWEGNLGRESVLARLEAGGEAVGEDLVIAAIGLVASPADTSRVVSVRALERVSSHHVEVLWKLGDVGP